jgi:HPt (histidine-containing phosphotransfer) domain-containing protein
LLTESLVKIVDQIDSIREISCEPGFFTVSHGLSGSFADQLRGLANVSAVNRHPLDLQPQPAQLACFDREHFNNQTFGDPGLQREIIGLFLKQLDDAAASLSEPMTVAAWRYLAHTLKGAAAAVGAVSLAKLAAAWELEGVPREPDGRIACHALFVQEYSVFRLAVAAYVA